MTEVHSKKVKLKEKSLMMGVQGEKTSGNFIIMSLGSKDFILIFDSKVHCQVVLQINLLQSGFIPLNYESLRLLITRNKS